KKDDPKQEEKTPSAFSPDARLLATASDKVISVTEAQTQRELMRIQGHRERVTSLAFSPDGKLLASGSRDKTISLWDIATGRRLQVPGPVVNVNFSPDGRTLTSREADKTVREWDVPTGKEVKKSKEKDKEK